MQSTWDSFRRLLAALLLSLSTAAAAHAGEIESLPGLQKLGSFSGTFNYSVIGEHRAVVDLLITNTTPKDRGGFLTAFAFNNPNDWISGVQFSASQSQWKLMGLSSGFKNGVKASPFGHFDLGAGLNASNWEGGGSPQKGLGVGQTAKFSFMLTRQHLDLLSTDSFFKTLSSSPGGEGAKAFVGRFRGFTTGGSDKVPGTLSDVVTTQGQGQQQHAPEPGALTLAALGALGLGWAAWKRTRPREQPA
jgi:hypothetical protein